MNIKLFYNEIIDKIIFDECNYIAIKMMLNNDGSVENINNQFMRDQIWLFINSKIINRFWG